MTANFLPSSRASLTLLVSLPSKETKETSLFWASVSASNDSGEAGVRRGRRLRRAWMERRRVWLISVRSVSDVVVGVSGEDVVVR